jgi:hypothetical protein
METFRSLAHKTRKRDERRHHQSFRIDSLLVDSFQLPSCFNTSSLKMFTARNAVRQLARPSMLFLRRTATRSLASEAAQAKQASSGNQSQQQQQQQRQQQLLTAIGAFMGLAVGGVGIALTEPQIKLPSSQPFQRPSIPLEDPNTPPPRPDLPTIALEDVAEHNEESSLWYT